MSTTPWMIYGAYGYTGELIAREAVKRGMRPVLAGRDEQKTASLAGELGLEHRSFAVASAREVAANIAGMDLVLHCAGPFSATAEPMVEACLSAGTHYLDITGEIAVIEMVLSQDARAREAGVVCCPAVGFDVIPTDCVAASLASRMEEPRALTLGFEAGHTMSPGTAKTSVEGLAGGGRIRQSGVIRKVPLEHKRRRIDFGNGEKQSVAIPWGDVASAYYSTGIPDIEVYIPDRVRPGPKFLTTRAMGSMLRISLVQKYLKRRIERSMSGPDESQRKRSKVYVWGEITGSDGSKFTGRMTTANGYDMTVTGSLAVVERLLRGGVQGGCYTPSMLMGKEFAETLPGSSPITIAAGGQVHDV